MKSLASLDHVTRSVTRSDRRALRRPIGLAVSLGVSLSLFFGGLVVLAQLVALTYGRRHVGWELLHEILLTFGWIPLTVAAVRLNLALNDWLQRH